MNTIIHTFTTLKHLDSFLATPELYANAQMAKSIFVQIYSSKNDAAILKSIVEHISKKLPAAVIVGSTTVGEIANGKLQLGTIILSISFFTFAGIKVITNQCLSCSERAAGQALINNIQNAGNEIAGVLLLATPLTLNITEVFEGMALQEIPFPIFGGGAGVYDASKDSAIFYANQMISRGMIAVVFLGAELHIFADSHLGWQPLSKEMTITESEGMLVRKVDDMPAYELYKRYLNIKNDSDFFINVLEFPFLVERDGYTVARVPFFSHEDGSIEFIADIVEGEKFRIGYGDPELIVQNATALQKSMADFQPESIFIYDCICRRFLMQNDINLETQPFEAIAPTAGFFTYGEFIRFSNKVKLMNSTIVVVGMREGEKKQPAQKSEKIAQNAKAVTAVNDIYSDQHNRIVSRLLYFISVLTAELEDSNRELKRLSETDDPTQIFNRMKLDKILAEELLKSELFKSKFSVIILDIDKFKDINDLYGHLAGDRVLADLALILKSQIRNTDFVGRWGGEEFLIILPLTGIVHALHLAEKIRKKAENHSFPENIHLTCSFGVSSYQKGDSTVTLIQRADNALYIAKRDGRNKVKSL